MTAKKSKPKKSKPKQIEPMVWWIKYPFRARGLRILQLDGKLPRHGATSPPTKEELDHYEKIMGCELTYKTLKEFLFIECNETQLYNFTWADIALCFKRFSANNNKPDVTVWSRPMTKSTIVTILHLDSLYKLNKLVKTGEYKIENVGNNRSSWKIRIDNFDDNIQKKLK